MDAIEAARREAERIHQAAVEAGNDPFELLNFARNEAARRDLDVYPLPEGDSQLKGGQAAFDSQAGIILYEDTGSEFDRAFLIAHELGHVVLEGGTQDLVTEHVEPDRTVEDAPVGIEKVMDYSARERREVRMDLFAREFLLPRSMLRRLHLQGGCSSTDIALRFGAPSHIVQLQLLDALLLPNEESADSTTVAHAALTPDPTQIAAAEHRNSAFLLQAGPGTGKTKTLVRRIESLLAATDRDFSGWAELIQFVKQSVLADAKQRGLSLDGDVADEWIAVAPLVFIEKLVNRIENDLLPAKEYATAQALLESVLFRSRAVDNGADLRERVRQLWLATKAKEKEWKERREKKLEDNTGYERLRRSDELEQSRRFGKLIQGQGAIFK